MAKEVTSAAQEKEWQAESDLRTLIEAEKIRKDKPRLAAAMKKARDEKAALTKLEQK